ncbi:hypothetical protein [Streptomyces chartreusis]|uniref:hypothetical protein n=1 Tax=Streptomyces chartreusis TaxID=1969 RepID=UPI0037B69291
MSRAEAPAPMPTGWPPARYQAVRRAMKVFRLADHLLRHGLAYTPADATDELIRTAAQQTGQNTPSETTCALVRASLALLLSPIKGDASGRVMRIDITIGDHPTA